MGKWHSLTSEGEDYGVGGREHFFFSVSFPSLNHSVAIFVCAAAPISKIKRITALKKKKRIKKIKVFGLERWLSS